MMAAYDPAIIRAALDAVGLSPSRTAKGKALEDLSCYLLEQTPGIQCVERNVMNTFATEEIDIACSNDIHPDGIGIEPSFFLVECKGWRDPVNSEQVAWFLTKIRHRGLKFGILIAANGITGEPEHLSRANFLVGVELATFGIRMIIVTVQEIETLRSGEEFAILIRRKVGILHATGGRCY